MDAHEKSVPSKKIKDDGQSANWGSKRDTDGNRIKWFGYKLHIATDVKSELPVALMVTPASIHDGTMAEDILKAVSYTHLDVYKRQGLSWDEGVDRGGPHSPYRQTERLSIYQDYVQELLDKDLAYPCFCTEEELEAEREALLAQGEMPRYSGKCRSLTEDERQAYQDSGHIPAIRFKVPENQVYVVHDLVRGQVTFESENEGDFIIMKSDGIPTYNFAVVIDDALMEITHVVRAEEHLANTPRQLMIYEALRFKRPEFAHISLILGEDRQKMSKRHGATSLIQYREMGYLPEALFNFLALLGWSPEGEEEILDHKQIADSFTLERVSRSPAVFDLDKLNWMNQQYVKRLDTQELNNRLQPFIAATAYAQQVEELSSEQLQ